MMSFLITFHGVARIETFLLDFELRIPYLKVHTTSGKHPSRRCRKEYSVYHQGWSIAYIFNVPSLSLAQKNSTGKYWLPYFLSTTLKQILLVPSTVEDV